MAFIDFKDSEMAQKALALDTSEIGGFQLTVNIGKHRADSGSRGRSGGRFSGRGRNSGGRSGRGGRGLGGRGGRWQGDRWRFD